MKRTDWIPGTIKPVRVGWYEVRHNPLTAPNRRNRYRLTDAPRRYFDGVNWRAGWMREEISIFGTHFSHEWRGLTRSAYRAAIAKEHQ